MPERSPALKRSSASLTGGIIVMAAVTVILVLLLWPMGFGGPVAKWGIAVAGGSLFGGYVRLADL